ncbi:MAG: decarboxylating NADP(+)-dependent phosphogluconate dehydrogenase [Waddliaceae bacterium]
MTQADIGLIGLAVMGQNLAMNMNDHGFKVAVYNRTKEKVDEFLEGPAKGSQIIGTHSLEELIQKIQRPRKILLMIKAGTPVDKIIEQILPLLDKGDIIIDGGNSHYNDTTRRCQTLSEKGILFVGAGISGGEEGARHGPSIMPGGNPDAWPEVKPILQGIAAKVENGEPCCEWVGDEGAGHYVKMVHNGIEYGDMQLICEAYDLMKELLGLEADELSKIFSKWNKGKLDSFLIEITSHIFSFKDEDGSPLVEKILDVAKQKGTGKWTGISALDLGVPVTLIGEAVFARCLSAMKEQRVKASEVLKGPTPNFTGDKEKFIEAIQNALYASKIISYTQGFMLIRQAAQEFNWKVNCGNIALMWRGGCIIRSVFLKDIKQAFDRSPELTSLLIDPFFAGEVQSMQESWRQVVSCAATAGIPVPCMSSGLSFFDGYRAARLPSNLLQAQRDYFGAHQYERLDQPRGEYFHTDWANTGGKVSSSTYQV